MGGANGFDVDTGSTQNMHSQYLFNLENIACMHHVVIPSHTCVQLESTWWRGEQTGQTRAVTGLTSIVGRRGRRRAEEKPYCLRS